ncbi:carboxylating nicotinate-nucleotide diphosphorylase [Candidatus Omnitrophota bacterium]
MIIDAYFKQLIYSALKEDIGSRDITTSAVVNKAKRGNYVIIAKQNCIICGLSLAEAIFETVDSGLRFKPLVSDGAQVSEGKTIAFVEGSCASILTAERTALNFLCWLSGISTLTDKFVGEVKDTKAKIMDTRKTIPTLRRLQKYAVKIGGGTNHRMGLYDQILIKDNHLGALGFEPGPITSLKDAVGISLDKARQHVQKRKKIEIEVDSLAMLSAALEKGPDIIMLDNMSIEDIEKSVKLRDQYRIKVGDVGFNVLLEVSGNVKLDNVKTIAQCGVDMISVGALTHSAPTADLSLLAQ